MAKVFTTETKPPFPEGVRLLSRDLTLYDLRYGVNPGFSKACSIDFALVFIWSLFQRTFKSDGLEALRKRDNKKAIELLQLSLKHEKSNTEEQRKTLKQLCELYFGETSFKECLATGQKLKATYWGKKAEDNDSFRVRLSYSC